MRVVCSVRAWRNGRRARFRIWCHRRMSSSLFARTSFHQRLFSPPPSVAHRFAVVAQLVERHLAKVEVASPSLVYRSNALPEEGRAFSYILQRPIRKTAVPFPRHCEKAPLPSRRRMYTSG